MKIIATKKSDQNLALVDPWTLVHFSVGLAAGLANVPPKWAIAGAVAYELAEQIFERTNFGQRFFSVSGPETLLNAALDVFVFAAGQYLGDEWNQS